MWKFIASHIYLCRRLLAPPDIDLDNNTSHSLMSVSDKEGPSAAGGGGGGSHGGAQMVLEQNLGMANHEDMEDLEDEVRITLSLEEIKNKFLTLVKF